LTFQAGNQICFLASLGEAAKARLIFQFRDRVMFQSSPSLLASAALRFGMMAFVVVEPGR
jgi:hypothetical protein